MRNTEIGKLVQERRAMLSLNQQDVAEMAGVTSKTIYTIESNKGNPTLQVLQKVLDVLGLEMIIEIKKIDE